MSNDDSSLNLGLSIVLMFYTGSLQLVIKVFNDEDPTSKTILVDQSWTAWGVCKKMIVKYDREASTNWVLEERQPGNQLRMYTSAVCI